MNFQVIDGVYGMKGEAGMPGRFGYDGFPGDVKLRLNYRLTPFESNIQFEFNNGNVKLKPNSL